MRNTKLYSRKTTKRYLKTNKLLTSKKEAYDNIWSPEATPYALKNMPLAFIFGKFYLKDEETPPLRWI